MRGYCPSARFHHEEDAVAPSKPGKLVKAALEKAVEKVTELVNPPIPGAPEQRAAGRSRNRPSRAGRCRPSRTRPGRRR